jgi:lipoic acid synthetase
MLNRLPFWFRQRLPSKEAIGFSDILRDKFKLNTVCNSARCPNSSECFSRKHATFLILGGRCTRDCSFCNIEKFANVAKEPDSSFFIDEDEPRRVLQAVKYLGLKYVVITSVSRDDLSDGGAKYFARTIQLIKSDIADVRVEVLIPDFMGSRIALGGVLKQNPDVIAHNLETVRSMYSSIRSRADYERSLKVLRDIKNINPNQISKSSIMLGLGEDEVDLRQALADLRSVNCDMLVLGQYLRPSRDHYPVQKFYSPEEFDNWKDFAFSLGFKSVCSFPLARTSYLAKEQEKCMTL